MHSCVYIGVCVCTHTNMVFFVSRLEFLCSQVLSFIFSHHFSIRGTCNSKERTGTRKGRDGDFAGRAPLGSPPPASSV